jgi:S-adenosylmethionine:tRNA ribosyltransferase-isomerase
MHPRDLSIQDFTFALPNERIAQQPLAVRDGSKLLVYRNGKISDGIFRELPEQLPKNALLVLNRTKVVNARILFQRETGARIEVLCLSPLNGPVEQAISAQGSGEWNCFIGNAKRWKAGEVLTTNIDDTILNAQRSGQERIRFTWEPAELTFSEVLERIGHVPLPPYMQRVDNDTDKERYNTVFAKQEGSVAAPTASLHFSKDLLERLEQKGTKATELVLHVGAGTFLPVKSERMADHHMHTEEIHIPLAALEVLHAQLGQGSVIPVGTTALRTLESVFWHGVKLLAGDTGKMVDVDQWEPYGHGVKELPSPKEALEAVIEQVRTMDGEVLRGRTGLLIAPGYTFRFANGLITNFHQPNSTLLLLVAAFVGNDWRRIYEHALENEYRFLSYGDGSLLLPKEVS